MSIHRPIVVESPNLALAWGQALLHSFESSRRTLAPIIVSIANFDTPVPLEDTDIRQATDEALERLELNSVRVSGLMIFPYDMWCRRGKPASTDFASFCMSHYLPRLRKLDKRNLNGTYFGRMMGFTGVKGKQHETVDQLSFVINLLKRRASRWPRQSALQISCFDPAKDHTGQPVRGFPCLQQVSVAHDGDGRFALSAYYPTQYVFDRGYGNYLGLSHLAAFIAHETGLQFVRLNCFVGRPDLGSVSKGAIAPIVELIRSKLN